MKFLVCVSLIVVLLDEFNCAPLINYDEGGVPGGYYDERSSSNSWGYNLGGHLNMGVAGGYENGKGYFRTDNDGGLAFGGFNNDRSMQTRYPINSAYGNGNPYGSNRSPNMMNSYGSSSYNLPKSPSYEGSTSQSFTRPTSQSYDEVPQSEYEVPQGPQRRAFNNEGSMQTRYPINSAYGDGNPNGSNRSPNTMNSYGSSSYNLPMSPSYEGSTSQSFTRPTSQSYHEVPQSEHEAPQESQRRPLTKQLGRLRTTIATPLYD